MVPADDVGRVDRHRKSPLTPSGVRRRRWCVRRCRHCEAEVRREPRVYLCGSRECHEAELARDGARRPAILAAAMVRRATVCRLCKETSEAGARYCEAHRYERLACRAMGCGEHVVRNSARSGGKRKLCDTHARRAAAALSRDPHVATNDDPAEPT